MLKQGEKALKHSKLDLKTTKEVVKAIKGVNCDRVVKARLAANQAGLDWNLIQAELMKLSGIMEAQKEQEMAENDEDDSIRKSRLRSKRGSSRPGERNEKLAKVKGSLIAKFRGQNFLKKGSGNGGGNLGDGISAYKPTRLGGRSSQRESLRFKLRPRSALVKKGGDKNQGAKASQGQGSKLRDLLGGGEGSKNVKGGSAIIGGVSGGERGSTSRKGFRVKKLKNSVKAGRKRPGSSIYSKGELKLKDKERKTHREDSKGRSRSANKKSNIFKSNQSGYKEDDLDGADAQDPLKDSLEILKNKSKIRKTRKSKKSKNPSKSEQNQQGGLFEFAEAEQGDQHMPGHLRNQKNPEKPKKRSQSKKSKNGKVFDLGTEKESDESDKLIVNKRIGTRNNTIKKGKPEEKSSKRGNHPNQNPEQKRKDRFMKVMARVLPDQKLQVIEHHFEEQESKRNSKRVSPEPSSERKSQKLKKIHQKSHQAEPANKNSPQKRQKNPLKKLAKIKPDSSKRALNSQPTGMEKYGKLMRVTSPDSGSPKQVKFQKSNKSSLMDKDSQHSDHKSKSSNKTNSGTQNSRSLQQRRDSIKSKKSSYNNVIEAKWLKNNENMTDRVGGKGSEGEVLPESVPRQIPSSRNDFQKVRNIQEDHPKANTKPLKLGVSKPQTTKGDKINLQKAKKSGNQKIQKIANRADYAIADQPKTAEYEYEEVEEVEESLESEESNYRQLANSDGALRTSQEQLIDMADYELFKRKERTEENEKQLKIQKMKRMDLERSAGAKNLSESSNLEGSVMDVADFAHLEEENYKNQEIDFLSKDVPLYSSQSENKLSKKDGVSIDKSAPLQPSSVIQEEDEALSGTAEDKNLNLSRSSDLQNPDQFQASSASKDVHGDTMELLEEDYVEGEEETEVKTSELDFEKKDDPVVLRSYSQAVYKEDLEGNGYRPSSDAQERAQVFELEDTVKFENKQEKFDETSLASTVDYRPQMATLVEHHSEAMLYQGAAKTQDLKFLFKNQQIEKNRSRPKMSKVDYLLSSPIGNGFNSYAKAPINNAKIYSIVNQAKRLSNNKNHLTHIQAKPVTFKPISLSSQRFKKLSPAPPPEKSVVKLDPKKIKEEVKFIKLSKYFRNVFQAEPPHLKVFKYTSLLKRIRKEDKGFQKIWQILIACMNNNDVDLCFEICLDYNDPLLLMRLCRFTGAVALRNVDPQIGGKIIGKLSKIYLSGKLDGLYHQFLTGYMKKRGTENFNNK